MGEKIKRKEVRSIFRTFSKKFRTERGFSRTLPKNSAVSETFFALSQKVPH